jgi:hypothetical protein
VIPWSVLVRHAPTLLAAADALLARRSGRTNAAALESDERLRKLEQTADESAQLLHGLAAQVQALTEMQAKAAKQARIALGLAIVAVLLAAAAVLVILFRQ